jgi:hypothetical protein
MLKYALLAAPASALFATSFILPTRADAMTFNTPVGVSSAAATNDVAQREQVRWLKERLVRCNLRIPCPPRGRSQFYAAAILGSRAHDSMAPRSARGLGNLADCKIWRRSWVRDQNSSTML